MFGEGEVNLYLLYRSDPEFWAKNLEIAVNHGVQDKDFFSKIYL